MAQGKKARAKSTRTNARVKAPEGEALAAEKSAKVSPSGSALPPLPFSPSPDTTSDSAPIPDQSEQLDQTERQIQIEQVRQRLEMVPELPLSIARHLIPKHCLMLRAHAVCGNWTLAAEVAGYSKSSAATIGVDLAKKSVATEATSWLLEQLDPKSAPWVIARLEHVYNVAMAAIPVLDRKGNFTGEYKVDIAGANRALELIGKHVGMFQQKVEVTHKGEIHHLLEAVAARGKPTLEQRRAITINAKPERGEPVPKSTATSKESAT